MSRHPDVTPETVTANLASASPAAKGTAAERWARITEKLLTEGREEGRLEERAENRALFCATLLIIAQERFGPISAAQKDRIESASIAEVLGWIMACATGACGTLDELLGQHQ